MFRSIRNLIKPIAKLNASRSFALNSSKPFVTKLAIANRVSTNPSFLVGRAANVHTKLSVGEKDLVDFLKEEIENERKVQEEAMEVPEIFEGFLVDARNAEISFHKQLDNETVKISVNVNHSVDADFDVENDTPNQNEEDFGELKSKPNFKVDVKRNDTTLSFFCAPANANNQDTEYTDKFVIEEISIFDGEWDEKVYSVSGDIIDKYMYDLFMNYLEEKGVSNEFVDKLTTFCTNYEHQSYIQFLESISKFASRH